ncbi:hypothetical protein CLOSTMETH_02027 [[Clostridium] methylpentosum DSM 5476]|uniref:Uncharacterized protein n=1 Tax=[Clostridium] methylpentosum DSM 5476 TaxID=537013 RepID=C0EDU8_9FIRM|nr:hypothetical protein CLOSTMETH_02027 [[Clostridium] methylpentosum DSM 5476]MEE1490500.1 hypothetical protein [Massilioclostridium sp.]
MQESIEQVSAMISKMIDDARAEAKREEYRAETLAAVTPEEIEFIFGKQDFSQLQLANSIYRHAKCASYSGREWAIGMVFCAGKVLGIRQERARRRESVEC